ncbi:MAG: DUF3618 domain-containing protein [Acidobacteria bacterium]|nr:DUF3618 domain-containing protein [Acidobacteriota bacterium]
MAERDRLISDPSHPGQTQERSAEEIRQDIAATRESITNTVDRLHNRVQETFDWRTYVADYPLAALAMAAGVGFCLASFFRSRRSTPGERIKDALAESIEDITGKIRHRIGGEGADSGVNRAIKAAVTGAITKAATGYLRDKFVSNSQYE